MSRFRAVFGDARAVLPIIHVAGRDQALRNTDTARAGGADGAFLISHGSVSDDALLDICRAVREAQPGFWLGVNCLSLRPEELFARLPAGLRGVWSDQAGIDETTDAQPAAARITDARASWDGLYFGGVAFKYQRPVRDPAAAALRAAPWMDVVTTSGPGTGQAAPPAKVRSMKQALGDHPLALA
ncbi:MAG: hypothetical protein K2W96_14980, partial [Gemmataceae bacterium]|nr:hypothetical protein [Gemmataceae bacterium]